VAGGVIVQRKAGAMIPDGYLERLLKLNLKSMSIVGIDKQEGMKIEKLDAVPSLEDFKNALATDKREAFMWFSLYPSTYDERDKQPFLLLGEEDDPLLCVMMEGDYVANTTDKARLDVWHASEEMVEEINTLFDLCGKDLDKLIIALMSKSQRNNFANKIKTNGTMLFLPSSGESWVVSKDNKFERKEDWGYTSNILGFNPAKDVEKDNASERKPAAKSFAAAFGKAPITTTPAPDTAIPPAKEPLTLPPKPTDEPALGRISNNTIAKAKLKELRKLAAQMSWNGQTPPELTAMPDGTPITEKSQIDWSKVRIITKEWKAWETAQKNKDFPKAVEAEGTSPRELSLKEKLALKRAAEAKANAPAEPIAPEVVPEPVVEEPVKKDTIREFVPIPTPESQSEVESIILDIVSDGERKIPPPKAAKEMDKVSFSERFGLNSCDEIKFEDGDLWTLVTKYQREAYLLLKEAMATLEQRKAPTQVVAKPSQAA
jgi:hypothetical protein